MAAIDGKPINACCVQVNPASSFCIDCIEVKGPPRSPGPGGHGTVVPTMFSNAPLPYTCVHNVPRT